MCFLECIWKTKYISKLFIKTYWIRTEQHFKYFLIPPLKEHTMQL